MGTAVTVIVTLLALAALGVGGTAVGIYYESQYLVFGSWGIIALVLATILLQRFNKAKAEEGGQ